MARITITVLTTLHGKVEIEQVFDETCITDQSITEFAPRYTLTCVADAIARAGETIAAAHGEHLAVTR